MAIEFVCTSCRKTLRVPDEHLGKNARCPACQTINVIQPASSADAPNLASPEIESSAPHSIGSASLDKPAAPRTNPYAANAFPEPRQHLAPHRGGLILALGIVSMATCIFMVPGILAWVLGSSDLKQMKAGLMDRGGESMTTAGMVLGIISVVFPLLLFLLYIAIVILVVFFSVLF